MIKSSALHVYNTALPFSPKDTLLCRTYEKEMDATATVLQGTLPLWSPCLSTIHGEGGQVKAIACSLDGSRVAIGSQNNAATLWEAQSCALTHTLLGHIGPVLSVAFSPDSSKLATGSQDGTARLWDTLSGASTTMFKGHTASVHSVVYLPDGVRLVTASSDNTVRIWNTITGNQTLSISVEGVSCVAAFPDGSRLVSGQRDGTLQVFESTAGTHIDTLSGEGSDYPVLCVATTSRGAGTVWIAAGAQDGSTALWDASSRKMLEGWQISFDAITAVAFSEHLMASGSTGKVILRWPIDDITKLNSGWAQPSELWGHSSQINGIAFSPDRSHIVSASNDGTWKLWDSQSTASVMTSNQHISFVRCHGFSPDCKLLATGDSHGEVKLWDARTGEFLKNLKGDREYVNALTFSLDSTGLAGGKGDTVRLWSMISGECVATLRGHDSTVRAVAFSDDGTRLISKTETHTYTWDRASSRFPVLLNKIEEETYTKVIMATGSGEFTAWYDDDRWLWIQGPRGKSRVAFIIEEFRISSFGFHKDRVVFTCSGGQVLLMDVSRPMALLS